ncbi:protein kinase [Pseudogemmatithrix spongiicola]|uniref:non-specific serine/threonine protein kinase n=1 Tax=Pseudogemmatithrix spongiicola TaxID=3062599 RepID=A0AA49JYI0_9BACT|nr:protein kinase [Gemmatimonadaceae bacterium 'strain 138']WKW14301.1 protein kinase [Gemmatimonadaceae bacterium 'strain 318']
MSLSTERLSAALDGRYRIERELGAGGMATVYLAHDLKHDRKVAVKVLKPELAAVLGAERFVVEIKTTAALQHPHILPLFDSGEAGGFLYYVMPFIEGETLRDRLNRESQLGVDEAVRMACDIADALHYAHEHGVIHRDIKPENILLQNGRPMVADFGIALAVSAAAGGRMTETGLSLGTQHYMSPEQATAEKEITSRSDVYSLASVLYEMLTGNPPHTGATAQQIIMKIITEQAQDVTALRKSVPAHVADAVAQALEKLPADRFSSASAFAAALQGGSAPGTRVRAHGGSRVTAGGTAAVTGGPWRSVALVAAALAIAASLTAFWALGRARPAERVKFTYRPILPGNDRQWVDISSDGRSILQVVRDSNGTDLVAIRDLASATMRLVAGTEGARDPTFTPDGASIVFQTQGTIRRVPVGGGPSSVLVDSGYTSGLGIHPDGSLLLSALGRGLIRVRPGQRTQETITVLDSSRREFAHWYPEALPGGRVVIYTSYSSPANQSRIEAVDLESGEQTVLVRDAVFGRYVHTGHLLFARAGAVFAVRFDPKTLQTVGEAEPVIEDVYWSLTNGLAGFGVADNGTLVYIRASEAVVTKQVVWADRSGRVTPVLQEPGSWSEPRLSPDGRWIALTRTSPDQQIWLFDNTRRVLSQFSRFSDGIAFGPVWTPDSRALVFAREVPQYNIHRQRLDSQADEALIDTRHDKVPSSVSADGHRVVYYEVVSETRLTVTDLRTGASRQIGDSNLDGYTADFSPDGRWIAYDEFDAAGTVNTYVRLADGTGGRRQVSADGGDQPIFARNGREITYRKGDAVYAVSFESTSGEIGTPTLLFRLPDGGRLNGGRTRGYDVTPDGQRFLLIRPIDRPGAAPNVVITNWTDELRKKLPR